MKYLRRDAKSVMRSRGGSRRWDRTGFALVVLTLLSHLTATFGFPLPAETAEKPGAAGPAFPCQNRPCGCSSSVECWAGDCCCFTLEEKLAWADANGVEPPAHVRPMVESRRAKSPPEKPAACCCEAGGCDETPAFEVVAVRWVVGLFAKKCRGDGPAGLFDAEPAIPPEAIFEPIRSLPLVYMIDRPRRAVSVSHVPPTPPPRSA